MPSAATAALLFLLAAGGAKTGAACTLQAQPGVSANESSTFARPIRFLAGRNVYIEEVLRLSERDVTPFCLYRRLMAVPAHSSTWMHTDAPC